MTTIEIKTSRGSEITINVNGVDRHEEVTQVSADGHAVGARRIVEGKVEISFVAGGKIYSGGYYANTRHQAAGKDGCYSVLSYLNSLVAVPLTEEQHNLLENAIKTEKSGLVKQAQHEAESAKYDADYSKMQNVMGY